MTHGYESYEEMRKFIDGLKDLDELGREVIHIKSSGKKKVPIHDADEELIYKLLYDWFSYMTDQPLEKEKVEFVIKVFKDLKKMTIQEDWYFYISAIAEWLRLSSKDPMTANLAIFLMGYVWRENNTSNEDRGE